MAEASLPRIACIGCGYWGKNLVRNVSGAGTLAAVSDVDGDCAAEFASEYGVPAQDFDDILASPEIDAVVIAAPAELHGRMAASALAAGKHVFVEKPVALRVHEAVNLAEVAERSGLTLMVGHLLQYHPVFLKLREMVEKGELGRLQYIYSNRLNLGKIRRSEDVFWSFAPHDISMILGLAREEPDEICASGASYLHKVIADVTTTHMSFPSGLHAHVFVSWLHPFKEQKLVVVGEKAMAVFDDTLPWEEKLAFFRHQVNWQKGMPVPVKVDPIHVEVEQAEPLRAEIDHFIHCVATGASPRTDGREGVRVLRVLDAAAHAAVSGSTKRSESAPPEPEAGTERGGQPDDVFVHPSSYVDDGSEVGSGTKIWHFSHVLGGTKIGENCVLGQNVMAGPDVTVGDNCKIQNNVSLYKGVQLGDGVFCGPSCVFTNVINPRAEVERKDEFKETLVGNGATIGANATIMCGNSLGEYAFIAAGAVVTKPVPDYALMAGVPARRIGWMSRSGDRLGDDLICPRTGQAFAETDDGRLVQLASQEAGA